MSKLISTAFVLCSLNAFAAEGSFFPTQVNLPDLHVKFECPNNTSPHAGIRFLSVEGLVVSSTETLASKSETYRVDLQKGYLEVNEDYHGPNTTSLYTSQLAGPWALNSENALMFRKGLKVILDTAKQCKDGLMNTGEPFPFDMVKHPELDPIVVYLTEVLAQTQE